MTSEHPYYNDSTPQKVEKVLSILRILYAKGDLGVGAKRTVVDLANKVKANPNRLPTETLSEPEARKLRAMLFRSYSKYKSFVPRLPDGVAFEEEVRRLLKGEANPNEERNSVISNGEAWLKAQIEGEAEALRLENRSVTDLETEVMTLVEDIEVEYFRRSRKDLTYKVRFTHSLRGMVYQDMPVEGSVTITHEGLGVYTLKTIPEGMIISTLSNL